jgi:peroxiredoxin
MARAFVTLATLSVLASGASGAAMGIGSPAPEFTAVTHTGASFSLSDYRGKCGVVMWFFPKAGTGG